MDEFKKAILAYEYHIQGLKEARDQCKCSEIYINDRIQELEEELEDLYNE